MSKVAAARKLQVVPRSSEIETNFELGGNKKSHWICHITLIFNDLITSTWKSHVGLFPSAHADFEFFRQVLICSAVVLTGEGRHVALFVL